MRRGGHDREFCGSSEAGFTLMEVMVASILITIVLSAVYTLFYSTITSWRAVEQGYDIHQEGRNFAGLLQREMNNLLPEAEHLFEGEDEELTMFVVSEPIDVEENTGRHLLRVRYRYSPGKNEIIREEGVVETALPKLPPNGDRPVRRERIKVKDEDEQVVAENVTDFELRYIWIPFPDEARPEGLPPVRIDPLRMDEHKEIWRVGYPSAVELHFTLTSPDKDSEQVEMTVTAPIRLPGHHWTRDQLSERMGRAS